MSDDEYLDSIRARDRLYDELAMKARAINIAETKLYLSDSVNMARQTPSDVASSKRRLKALLAIDIRAAREMAGLTQEAVAKLAGIQRTGLALAETGGQGEPFGIGTLERIRALLHQKIAEDAGRVYEDIGIQTVLARLAGSTAGTTLPSIQPDERQRMRAVLASPMEDEEAESVSPSVES